MEWEEDVLLPEEGTGSGLWEEETAVTRLDMLLPRDHFTGVVTTRALKAYLTSMIEMTMRSTQPLSLICLAVDDCPNLASFLQQDGAMLAQALSRCLRQETRPYDVVGCLSDEIYGGLPAYVIVCPLMNEDQVAQLGERLIATMNAYATDAQQDWLTLSIGVAGMSLTAMDTETLLLRCCSALQRARQQGGKSVWRHSDTLNYLKNLSENEDRQFPEP